MLLRGEAVGGGVGEEGGGHGRWSLLGRAGRDGGIESRRGGAPRRFKDIIAQMFWFTSPKWIF